MDCFAQYLAFLNGNRRPSHVRRLFIYSIIYLLYLAKNFNRKYFTVNYACFRKFCKEKLGVDLGKDDMKVFWFVLFYFFNDCITVKEEKEENIETAVDLNLLRFSLRYFDLRIDD